MSNAIIRSPFSLLLLFASLVLARWILIAGVGECGTSYKPAFRILQGEAPYRDFIATLPPIAPYSLALVMRFLGPKTGPSTVGFAFNYRQIWENTQWKLSLWVYNQPAVPSPVVRTELQSQ